MPHRKPMSLVLCCVLMFACGVGAMASFDIFFRDLYSLEGYITYLRAHWSGWSWIVGAGCFAINVLAAVAIYWDIKLYIAWQEAQAIRTAKEVEKLGRTR